MFHTFFLNIRMFFSVLFFLNDPPPPETSPLPLPDALPIYIAVARVLPSPGQMGKQSPAEGLRELADSIRQHGIIQPILAARQRRSPAISSYPSGRRRTRMEIGRAHV